MCGLGKIDISDWKSNTRLKHCTPDSNIVKWFWKAVESFDEERRARLLQFVTGSSRVPLQGFKALQGTDFVYRGTHKIPEACFTFFKSPVKKKPPKHVWLKFMKDSWKRVQGFISWDEWVTYSGIWWWTAADGYCLCFDCRCCWAQTLHHSSDWC